MRLLGKKFYTVKFAENTIVLWVNGERDIADPKAEIRDSTEEEKEYWVYSMEQIDNKIKNNYMGVDLKDFDRWKAKKIMINLGIEL